MNIESLSIDDSYIHFTAELARLAEAMAQLDPPASAAFAGYVESVGASRWLLPATELKGVAREGS